ncbi:LOW QUALITY PROTEIN: conserved hypothetical protein, partial [Streptomyces lividans TK24]
MGCPPVRQGTAADGSRALAGSAGRGRWDPGAGGRAWPLLPEESADDRSEFAGGESAGACGAEGETSRATNAGGYLGGAGPPPACLMPSVSSAYSPVR